MKNLNQEKEKLSYGRQNISKLTAESSDKSFNSSDLEELRGSGILDELISIIKSGKEVTVYNENVLKIILL